MKLVKPSIEFMDMNSMGLKLVEKAGRTCYKSEKRIAEGTDITFTENLLNHKPPHEAMIEFGWMCYKAICNRGVTHELVRHRLYSFAQESTRYVNYKKGVEFIIPPHLYDEVSVGEYLISTDFKFSTAAGNIWLCNKLRAEHDYKGLILAGWQAQQARDSLPIALKTEIVFAGNFREWRHFFNLRTNPKAHPQMVEVANLILNDAVARVPVLFDEYLK